MSVLSLTYIGNPILRKKAKQVRGGDPELARLARDMIETLHEENGIGLAAPQVGASVSVMVFDLSTPEVRLDPVVLLNPQVVETCTPEIHDLEEGCLSVPGLRHVVRRPACITVEGYSIEGKRVLIEKAEGMLARVLQHEIDHLNGLFFLDRLSEPERLKIADEIKRIEKEAKRSGKK